ncbi:MAG TPA: DUF72 domain-containing protein [Caulobacteraceae bacterium]|jgi:uncharacterized protein YecE (DUF72 family)
MAEVRIGCSGWCYRHWKGGVFYPERLKAKDEFAYYASRFDTAEINNSFYRLPTEAASRGWREKSPPGFLFAWKASRYLTHMKRLLDPAEPLALMFSRADLLGEKLGPVLFQLPPGMHRNDERLAAFLPLLGPSRRYAFEFRHPSWYAPEVFALLRAHDVSLCLSDHHHAPAPWEATASWVYVRGHGPGGRYWGRYPPETLEDWAGRIRAWNTDGRDVVCYFDNDPEGAAPKDADVLKGLLAA